MKFQKLFWILFNALSQTSCGMDTLKTPGLEECRWHPGVFERKQVTKWHETTKSLTWCRQLDSVPQRDQKLPEVCQVCPREAHEADCTESEDLDEISRPSFCEPRRWQLLFSPPCLTTWVGVLCETWWFSMETGGNILAALCVQKSQLTYSISGLQVHESRVRKMFLNLFL